MPVVLGSLRFNVNAMAADIHHIERVEPAISFYVTGPQQVRLVNVVTAECLSEIGILDSLRRIRGFF